MVRGTSPKTRADVRAEPLEPRILLAPLLLKDIPTGNHSSFPADALTLGSTTFFTADDGVHGTEIWTTDGTADGTQLWRDLWPGNTSSSPSLLAVINGLLYFNANDGTHNGLWRTDGTTPGTVFLTGVGAAYLTPFNGSVYFKRGVGGALYKTDGTPGGTVLIDDTVEYGDLHFIGDRIFFGGSTSASGDEPWVSDGTPQGRFLLKDIAPGSGNSIPWGFVPGSGLVFFVASSPTGRQLWKSDGTSPGTVPVPGAPSDPRYLTSVSGRMIFTATTDRYRIWTSDGTSAGTVPIADVKPASSDDVPFLVANGFAYFYASGPAGNGLWKSDGTAAGTTLFKPFTNTSADTLTPVKVIGDTLFFLITHSGTPELWKTDGTQVGTSLIASGLWSFSSLLEQRGGQYLLALGDSLGTELWTTDNSAAGASMLKDINTIRIAPAPFLFTDVNGTLFFIAAGKLWKSDGTDAGTIPFTSGPTGTLGSDGGVNLNGTWIYTTFNGIWRSDGTPEGTSLIKSVPIPDATHDQMLADNGLVFFADGNGARQLWRTDGTPAGTFSITKTGLGAPTQFFDFDGVVYFSGTSPTTSTGGLWRTDGTAAGTVLVSPSTYRYPSSLVRSAVVMNHKIYFGGCDANGCELWSTDGTNPGAMIKDISPGSATSSPNRFTLSNGTVFFQATNAATGTELWKTDGSAQGTQLVKDIVPGTASSNPRNLTDINGTLFFSTDSGLWKSDGTQSGTIQVAPFTTVLNEFVQVGNLLFFLVGAPNGSPQNEIWKSDGTAAGTQKVMDYQSGQIPVLDLVTINGTAYFRGNGRPQVGGEPWKLSPPTPRSSGPYTVGIGSSIRLAAGTSSDPDPNETLSFAWDLDNNGTFETPGATPTFSAADLAAGSYPIKLRVTNSFGLSSTLATTVTVRDARLHGTAGDDHFRIALNPSSSAADFYENAAAGSLPTFSIPLSKLAPITIDAGGGDDSLAIASGSYSLSASTDLENLSLTGDSSLHLVAPITLSALSIRDTATLDIGQSLLTLTSADLSTIVNLIRSGRIQTSFTRANSRIAAIQNDAGEIEVLYTLIGDLNFDRSVSIADFLTLSSNLNKTNANWADGDVNDDGIVSIADFLDLASNFNQSFTAAAQSPSPTEPMTDTSGGIGDPPDTLDFNGLSITYLSTNLFGDSTHTGNIVSGAQYDVYAFNADVSGVFQISTTGPLDSQIRLYESSGESDGGVFDVNVGGEMIKPFLDANHRYYIAIGGHDSDVGNYSLSIDGPASTAQFIDTPSPFYNRSTFASIDVPGDRDFFKIVAPPNATSVDLYLGPQPDTDLLLEVYDANGALLQMSNNGGTSAVDSVPELPVQGGATYYVAVAAVQPSTSAAYNLIVDFAPNAPGSIRGAKWIDRNSDDIRQAGEPGVAGVTIFIDLNDNGQMDANEPSTITDADGNYEFPNVAAGTYQIGQLAPVTDGWLQTLPGANGANRLLNINPSPSPNSLANPEADPANLYLDEEPAPNSGKIQPAFNISDSKWPQSAPGAPVTVTYSFGNLLDGGLSATLTAGQLRAAVQEALDLWAAVTPIKFVEVPDVGPSAGDTDYFDAGAADVRFGYHLIDPQPGILAHTFYPPPNGSKLDGDVHFNSVSPWTIGHVTAAVDFVETAVHEIGHALGMDHEPGPLDGGVAAIMNPFHGSRYNGPGTAFLFPDDIAGIQAIYGAPKNRPGTWRVQLQAGQTIDDINFGIFPTTFNGTDGNDDSAIRLAASDQTTVEINHAGATYSIKKARLNGLVFNGLGSDDRLTIDSTNGYPVPPGGIIFNGGDGTDTLTLIGAAHNFLIDLGTRGIDNIEGLSGASSTFYASQHLTSLVLADTSTAVLNAPVLRTTSLSIGNNASLDLKNNSLIIQSASISSVTGDISAGRLRSTANLSGMLLGAISNAGPVYSNFAGESGLNGSEILVRYTLIGDLNLDRSVSIVDFVTLASHLNEAGTWAEGDLNGDGGITIADFIDLAAHFNQLLAASSAAPLDVSQFSLSVSNPATAPVVNRSFTTSRKRRTRQIHHHRTAVLRLPQLLLRRCSVRRTRAKLAKIPAIAEVPGSGINTMGPGLLRPPLPLRIK